jgi:hypothetical protein
MYQDGRRIPVGLDFHINQAPLLENLHFIRQNQTPVKKYNARSALHQHIVLSVVALQKVVSTRAIVGNNIYTELFCLAPLELI